MTLSLVAFSKMTFSTTITQRKDIRHYNMQQNDIQHNAILQNDTQQNGAQHYDVLQNDTQHKSTCHITLGKMILGIAIIKYDYQHNASEFSIICHYHECCSVKSQYG
jgi:hypothetical protein